MIAAALAGLAAGAVACIVFACLCIRPAVRLLALVRRLPNNRGLRAVQAANDAFQSVADAGARLEATSRRFGSAAVAINSAAASIGAYASQVAIMAMAIDGLLELFVPRLRGMIE